MKISSSYENFRFSQIFTNFKKTIPEKIQKAVLFKKNQKRFNPNS